MSEYAKMNQAFKKRWVKALRSGRYKQGREALRTKDDEHCCLGVACRVGRLRGSQEWDDGSWDYGDGASYLHPDFENKIGLGPGVAPKLVFLNDVDGLTFGEIADWIEENL